MVSDTTDRRANARDLAACLEALSSQVDAPPMEIIVPHRLDVDGLEDVRKRFPHAVYIPVPDLQVASAAVGGREHHDVLRARGIAAAKGEIIGLLEDHARPDVKWCASVVAAHRQSYAAVGGAIENGVDRALNWAVYYCDFGRYQNPLPSGESPFASDANVTYKRSALEAIRATWEPSFREIVVNGALTSRGEKVALHPAIVVYQNRQHLRLGAALRERYVWGRSYAETRSALLGTASRFAHAALSPALPGILLLRMATTSWKRRTHFGRFLRALPLTATLVTVWSLGEAVGYLTTRRVEAAR
jgi:Glycosyl transferase family 2